MKASEARRISEEKKVTLKMALEGIEASAKEGTTTHIIPRGLCIDDNLVNDLVNLGYSVRKHTDAMAGFDNYIISW